MVQAKSVPVDVFKVKGLDLSGLDRQDLQKARSDLILGRMAFSKTLHEIRRGRIPETGAFEFTSHFSRAEWTLHYLGLRNYTEGHGAKDMDIHMFVSSFYVFSNLANKNPDAKAVKLLDSNKLEIAARAARASERVHAIARKGDALVRKELEAAIRKSGYSDGAKPEELRQLVKP